MSFCRLEKPQNEKKQVSRYGIQQETIDKKIKNTFVI